MKVGLFDSGIGGLSVLELLWSQTGNTSYMYLADFAGGPYGSKPREEILRLSVHAIYTLHKHGCDAVLFACNTATSSAANYLRERHQFPIFGMEPAVKPANLENPGKPIAIFATEFTLREDKFQSLVSSLGSSSLILPVPCEGLATLLDQDKREAAWEYIDQKLQLVFQQTNVIVLGCTHYIFLKDRILSSYPHAKVYDGNQGTVNHVRRVLNLPSSGTNSLQVLATGNQDQIPSGLSSRMSSFLSSTAIEFIS